MATKNDDTPAANEPTIWERLAAPFPASCVEWLPKKVLPIRDPDRNGKGMSRALALCYIDARSVMARLDDVVGPENWTEEYRVEGPRVICKLSIRVNGEWVAKEDASGDSVVEAEKGGISGSFKRAGVKWGIGRYLYDIDEVWGACKAREYQKGGKAFTAFVDWTAEARDDMAAALGQSPGPRDTEKPGTVKDVLSDILACDNMRDLSNLRDEAMEKTPLEYRAEVLRAFDARRNAITNPREQQENEQ